MGKITTIGIPPGGSTGEVLKKKTGTNYDVEWGTGGGGGGTITGTGTTNEITYWTGSTAIGSLTTSTYPSLTELSYVKGVTSAIQTQLNGKQATLTNPVTGTATSGQIAYWSGTSSITGESNLFWDATNDRLGIGTSSPSVKLDILFDVAGTTGDGVLAKNNSSTGRTSFIVHNNNAVGGSFGTFGTAYTITGVRNNFFIGATNSLIFQTNDRVGSGGSGTIQWIVGGYNETAAMTIFSNKNVAINTTTDAGYKLDVNGTTRTQGDLTISDAKNVILGTSTGTKIGTATSQKIGFFNATPVVQPTSVTTSQGIADALSSLGLLASSSISSVPDVGGKLYLFNSY